MAFPRAVVYLLLLPYVLSVSVHKHRHYYDDTGDEYSPCSDPTISDCEAGFSYNRDICKGPPYWSTISTCYHACNNGTRQSPINIVTATAKYEDLTFELKPKLQEVEMEVTNNINHSPEFKLDEGDLYTWSGDKCCEYKFKKLHLHCGNESSKDSGSEHSIDGEFKPMEAHLVFEKDNCTCSNGSENELLAIGVLLEVDTDGFGDEPNEDECEDILEDNKVNVEEIEEEEEEEGENTPGTCTSRKAVRISRILECAYRHSNIKTFNSSDDLDVKLTPEDLLPPKNSRHFFNYDGSLTTPPCNETVEWIVMKCPVTLSKRVLDALQDVEGYPDTKTLGLFGIQRPIQTNVLDVIKNFQ